VTVAVMVFIRDLRLADNPALAAAARAAAVVPLFVLEEAILRRAAGHPNRLGFLLDSLQPQRHIPRPGRGRRVSILRGAVFPTTNGPTRVRSAA
jgi:deoxyribodipyrimidine photo-lyase